MSSKRRTTNPSSFGNHMNFRPGGPDYQRSDFKGTRPTATAASVPEVLMSLVMQFCKKIIFYDIKLKACIYLGALFFVSILGDMLPIPKLYFSRSDNFFNVYFVKMGWAWTLALSIPFLVLTSKIVCCGDVNRLAKHHLPRIFVATAFWFIWTKLFNIIENAYGRCNARGFDSKSTCLRGGHFWSGFDISGHAFILIYSCLVLIDEARPIVDWELIRDHLRNEEHDRRTNDKSLSTNPLRNLGDKEFNELKTLYEKYTPHIRCLFVAITVLVILWDIMLICTMLYYHRLIEKILSGIFAIATWWVTYQVWYPSQMFSLPKTVGQGLFLYQKKRAKQQTTSVKSRRQSNLSSK